MDNTVTIGLAQINHIFASPSGKYVDYITTLDKLGWTGEHPQTVVVQGVRLTMCRVTPDFGGEPDHIMYYTQDTKIRIFVRI